MKLYIVWEASIKSYSHICSWNNCDCYIIRKIKICKKKECKVNKTQCYVTHINLTVNVKIECWKACFFDLLIYEFYINGGFTWKNKVGFVKTHVYGHYS